MGVPPNGWFLKWKVPLKWMMTGISPISGTHLMLKQVETWKKKTYRQIHGMIPYMLRNFEEYDHQES